MLLIIGMPHTKIQEISVYPDRYSMPSSLVTYYIGQLESYYSFVGTAALGILILGQIMLLINGKPHTEIQQISTYPDRYSLPSFLVLTILSR
jgi:hypothetical protein